jgi:hypothetical protein
MLPASSLAEIISNLAALQLEPNTAAQILAAVFAPLLRSSDPEPQKCSSGVNIPPGTRSQQMKHLAIAAVALALATTAAHATADGCAVVRKTPDGFLSLRQAPTAKALAIAKLKPGWHLSVDSATCETSGKISICGGTEWTHVTGVWPLDGGVDCGDTCTRGWVATRYLKFTGCEEAAAKAHVDVQALQQARADLGIVVGRANTGGEHAVQWSLLG